MRAPAPGLPFRESDHVYPRLDGLRALAVAFVCADHFGALPELLVRASLAQFGVRIFFVLSGFLITGILLRARDRVAAGIERASAALRSFIFRRGMRIFPIYYLLVLGAAALGSADIRDSLLWHLTYLSNVYFAKINAWHGVATHFWSLAVEEQFYLLWPCAVLLVPARWLRAVIFSCMGASLLYGAIVGGWLLPGSFAGWILLPGPLLSLSAGALLVCDRPSGTEASKERLWIKLTWLGLPVMLCSKAILLSGRRGLIAGLDNIAMTATATFLVAYGLRTRPGPIAKLLESPPLRYLGRISYGIYLFHPFARPVCAALLPAPLVPSPGSAAATFLWSAVTLAAASLSWFAIERPLLRLRDRLSLRKVAAGAPA